MKKTLTAALFIVMQFTMVLAQEEMRAAEFQVNRLKLGLTLQDCVSILGDPHEVKTVDTGEPAFTLASWESVWTSLSSDSSRTQRIVGDELTVSSPGKSDKTVRVGDELSRVLNELGPPLVRTEREPPDIYLQYQNGKEEKISFRFHRERLVELSIFKY